MSRRPHLRPHFWRLPLSQLSPPEWEALCDGCGKCCLNKLEYDDTGEIVFTRVACRLLDNDTARCGQYAKRRQFVPECIFLTPENIERTAYFMPQSCAYRLRAEGRDLPDWHPLITGDPESTHKAGKSVRGWTVPEFEVPEEDWEDYIFEEPT